MSVPAVIQFISAAYAAKTAIDGAREGNYAKAIIGAVGAYMGFSGLASGAAGTAAGTAGTEGAKNVAVREGAREVSTQAASDAAGSAAASTATQAAGTEASGQAAAAGISSGSSQVGQEVGQEVVKDAAKDVATKESGGLLSSAGQWVKDNPKEAYGLLQMGGNALAGYSSAKREKDATNERNAREDQQRERENSWVTLPSYRQGRRYNPETGRMETVQ